MIHRVLAGILAFSAGTAVAEVPKDCPTAAAGWQDYRSQVAQTLVQLGGIDPARTVYKTVDGCVGKAEGGVQPQAKACVQRILDLLAGDVVQGNTLGFNVPDSVYYAQTGGLTRFPAELSSPEFLALIQTWDKTDALAKYFADLNATRNAQQLPPVAWLTYQTPLVTPDDAHTPGRLLVIFPDPANHRTFWAQFGLTPPGSTSFSSHLFSITVMDPVNGQRQGYFHRFEKVKGADGKLAVTEATDQTPLDACVECHKSQGPLLIEPKQVEARFQDQLAQTKQLIEDYGPLASPYDLSPQRGPGMGTPGARTPEFIAACAADALDSTAADRKDAFIQTVRSAMNCAGCHDGETRGKLNMPLNPVVMAKYYWSGMMPPGSGGRLDQLTRSAVMNCMQAEYFGTAPDFKGTLYQWLTEPACP